MQARRTSTSSKSLNSRQGRESPAAERPTHAHHRRGTTETTARRLLQGPIGNRSLSEDGTSDQIFQGVNSNEKAR